MLSHNKIKIIQSLSQKKFRQKYNLFVVEGNKILQEIVKSEYVIEEIFATTPQEKLSTTLISEQEYKKITFQKNPQGILALIKIPVEKKPIFNQNTIILDGIQDPGNLGTIIRSADWFGIKQIICSENTVDLFNPKVIQATMGSFTRVSVFYTPISEFITQFEGGIYAADMNGTSVYETQILKPFALIMGNEGNGISENILQQSQIISIPNYSHVTESLNVSIANAILLAEITRNFQ